MWQILIIIIIGGHEFGKCQTWQKRSWREKRERGNKANAVSIYEILS